ncbi:putative peptidyl-tRNA hydrolase PTRHD1 [Halotydeus destructor]|nr:putative peptidyl-tRNA hydrolase PTRHD1 [Halotydeus destructor]
MPIVQYIVLRGDLSWPVGALVAQGCHASVAAIFKYMDKSSTQKYLEDIGSMHKVVVKAENEEQLNVLIGKLEANKIDHYVWVEQPENIKTCVAVAPNEKSTIQSYFRPFKLFS